MEIQGIRTKMNWYVKALKKYAVFAGRLAAVGVVAVATLAGAVNGRIAFSRLVSNGDWNIAVMNPDGSGVTTLAPRFAYQVTPAWSPDGKKIAFTRQLNTMEVYVMNADGSGQTNLTFDDPNSEPRPQDDFHPTWSPDGSRIAFTRGLSFTSLEIYVMNVDGTGRTRLTYDQACAMGPAWSPDGAQIAFASDRHNNQSAYCDGQEVYVMNSDGSNITRLTTANPAASAVEPVWSPDGTKIAFRENFTIYAMNADGSGVTPLTPVTSSTCPGTELCVEQPAWGTNVAPLTIPFAVFSVQILNGDPHTFHEQGSFTLGTASGGIDPVSDPVTLTFGTASITFPPGSFRQSGNSNHFLFDGTIRGILLHADIQGQEHSTTDYKFIANGNGLDLTGQAEPMSVGLQIGNKAGSVMFNANVHH